MIPEFKNFTVGELFYIRPTKSYGLTNDELLKRTGKTPVVTNSSKNNGILAYVDLKPTEQKGILTFSDTGMSATESIFYQPHDFVGYSHVQGMFPLFNPSFLTENVGQYIATAIRKSVKGKYDFYIKFNRESVAATSILLPVTENDEPNWEYMEGYIQSIKNKMTSLIEGFLSSQGFPTVSETILTEEDKFVIRTFEKADLQQFVIGDIFEKHLTLKPNKQLETSLVKTNYFDTPGITATNKNNGIGFYVHGDDHNLLENILTVSANGTNTGFIAYQPRPIAIAQDSYAIRLKEPCTKNAYLYLASAISKFSNIKYNYLYKAGWTRLSKEKISLPVYKDGSINIQLMDEYIKVIQKKVFRTLYEKFLKKVSLDYEKTSGQDI
ncbi:restriction endonuclease subunit S [Bacillus cereus]